MKKILLSLLLFVSGLSAFGQTSLTQTTLASAVATTSITQIKVASATGITVNQTLLYIDNEAMWVTGINGTNVNVMRGYTSTSGALHISGAMVLIGPPQAFVVVDPSGACTNGVGVFQFSPVVNIRTTDQWLCSTVTGKVIPGFGNLADTPQPSTAVASAAGLVTPSGPLFHITGTAAITGFNVPLGFDPKGGSTVCVIPDGIFTTTTANNIALASTAVVSKTLCWTYDANTAKFYPSY